MPAPPAGAARQTSRQAEFVSGVRTKRIARHELPRNGPYETRFNTASFVNGGELALLGIGVFSDLPALERKIGLLSICLRADGDVLAGCHRERTGNQTGHASEEDLLPVGGGRGNTENEAGG